MGKISRAIVLAAASATFLSAAARDTVPLVDRDSVAVVTGSGKPASAAAVGVAISNAAASGKRVWQVKRTAPDRLRATYQVRQHAVSVDIKYGPKAYSIHYAASDNMKYGEENGVKLIDPFYNSWVDELQQGISAQLGKL